MEVLGCAQVQLDVVHDGLAGEDVVLAVLAHRVEQGVLAVVVVDEGIQEDLGAGGEVAALAGQQAHPGREVAAGRVAHEHDVLGIGIGDDLAGEQGPGHGVAVLQRHGEATLGAAAVVNGDDPALQLQGRAHAGVAVEVHVAVGPAAAVHI